MKIKKLCQHLRYYVIFVALLMCLLITPPALGDGADAELHGVELTATPSSQGLGGMIIVDAAVYLYGGCCYHLYANDVIAKLAVPEGIDIIEGPTPEKYEEVDAQPGGTATVVHFKWSVKGSDKGTFNLSVEVETKNCGSVENEVAVDIVEGCIISNPDTYPKEPSMGKEIIITITASTSLEGRYVEKLTLFYAMGEEFENGVPKNDTIHWDTDEEKIGTAVPMEQDPYIPEQWTCKLEIHSSGKLNYWFVARDDADENTSSSLYTTHVVDQQRIDSITGTIFWGLILGSIIGFILIFAVQGVFAGRKASKRNILKLKAETEGKEKIDKARDIVVFGLLITSLVIVVLAFILGLVEKIVELSLG